MMIVVSAILLAVGSQSSTTVPERVAISVPSGRCRVIVDGKSMSVGGFADHAQRWKSSVPEIRFQPDHRAKYECVDRVLAVIRAASPKKLGFIGNELNVDKPQ